MQDVPEVTATYKMEQMYADMVPIEELPALNMNEIVTISGYIQKVSDK